MKTYFYSIDPGLGGTGWAEWRSRIQPLRVGIIKPRQYDSLARRCRDVGDQLNAVIKATRSRPATVPTIYCEFPMAMMASARGIAAQAGAIYKLTFLCGVLAGMLPRCDFEVVTPQEWKGQLPKAIVERRIRRILGNRLVQQLGITSHAFDAVGLGLWVNKRL